MAKQLPSRFRLLLEFDGSNYSGWQRQGEAKVRTMQGALLKAAAELFATTALDIQGSGRTDAGVHALEYTAHLEVITTIPPATIKARLNELLPANLVVLAVEEVHPRFHARHHCLGRSYLYRVARRKTAFARHYSWSVPEELDLPAMQAAAQAFTGMHDFLAFAEKSETKKSTKVLINALTVNEEEGVLLFRVVGSHFLWHLVRRLVAVLVEVGRGRLTMAAVNQLLTDPQAPPVTMMAPARGLFFEKAFYDDFHLEQFLQEGLASGPPAANF